MQPYESFGRVNQKRRTREALKAAAAALMGPGLAPTVGEVADAARVSRSTAYRYFPSNEALQAEVLLDLTIGDDLALIYQAADEAGTATARLDRVVAEDHRVVTAHEAAFRAALRSLVGTGATVENAVPRRPGNRLRYLAAALEPLQDRLSPPQIRRLVAALALCVGIESVVVTRDVCDLTDSEAEETKRWAAQALLRQALAEAAPDHAAPSPDDDGVLRASGFTP